MGEWELWGFQLHITAGYRIAGFIVQAYGKRETNWKQSMKRGFVPTLFILGRNDKLAHHDEGRRV
jgi:hypothetical protein